MNLRRRFNPQIKQKKLLPGYDVNGDGKVSVLEFKRIMLRSGKRGWRVEIDKNT